MNDRVIGIIGGSGWLGQSIAEAMLTKRFLEAHSLVISNRSGISVLRDRWSALRVFQNSQEMVAASDVVILSVRPEQFENIQINASGKLVISLMAGITSERIRTVTSAVQIVRAMPNAAVEIHKSYTPWFAGPDLSPGEKLFVQSLFETVGVADEVLCEEHIDYLTAVSGTGPAYPALLATILVNHAVLAGLPEAIARRAAQSLVVDASQMLQSHDSTKLLETLIDYKGVTAAALQEMIDSGMPGVVGSGIDAGVLVARAGWTAN